MQRIVKEESLREAVEWEIAYIILYIKIAMELKQPEVNLLMERVRKEMRYNTTYRKGFERRISQKMDNLALQGQIRYELEIIRSKLKTNRVMFLNLGTEIKPTTESMLYVLIEVTLGSSINYLDKICRGHTGLKAFLREIQGRVYAKLYEEYENS